MSHIEKLGVVCNKVDVDVRRELYEGREYLVFPAVAVRPMVLKGELLPAEEIATFVGAWDGRPVTLFHAKDEEGRPVSVNEPGRWQKQRVGWLFNTRINEQGALVPEVWLDIEKTKAAGDPGAQVLNAVSNGGQLDVSTAYWRETEPQTGTFNGVPYTGVSRSLRPDHLALLPGAVGECSWADGCGAPRINEQGPAETPPAKCKEGSMDVQQVLGILRQTGEALLSISNQETEVNMTNEQKVTALLAREGNIFDQAELEGMPPSALDKLMGLEAQPAGEPAAAVEPAAEEEPAVDNEGESGVEAEADPEPAATPALELSQAVLDFVAGLEKLGGAEAVLTKLQRLQAQDCTEKSALVERLAANSQVAFSREELEAMDLIVLSKLAHSLAPSNYGGRGLQLPSDNGGAQVLDMPSPWDN